MLRHIDGQAAGIQLSGGVGDGKAGRDTLRPLERQLLHVSHEDVDSDCPYDKIGSGDS